jgi:hypothetical protein
MFPWFASLWALATLVHQLSFTFWLQTWEGWLLTFATCLVVLEPRCLVRFSALILFSLLNLWHKLPFVPNHMLFEGMLNLTILLVICGVVGRRSLGFPAWSRILREFVVRFRLFFLACGAKAVFLLATEAPRNPALGGATSAILLMGLGQALAGRPPQSRGGEEVVAEVAPILRVQAVVVYWWAVIQKLNHDYFNPEVSCGAVLHRDMAGFLPFLPTAEWAICLAIYGSLALEFVIPLLLLLPKTRPFGIFLGVLFHLWLSIHPAGGIYSFSALLFALYFLFLPASVLPGWERLMERQLSWLQKRTGFSLAVWLPRIVIGLFLVGVSSQAMCYTVLGRTRETFEVANRIGFWLWAVFGVWLGGTHLAAMWQAREEPMEWPNRPVGSVAWVVVLLVIGNGLSPWIGLKTQTCFSMYSNLRSEAFGNHLFLERIDLFGYQLDLVELVASEPDLLDPTGSPTRLQHFANTGRIFPYFELRRLVSEHRGDLRMTYRRYGEDQEFVRRGGFVTGDERLTEPIPWWLRKVLWFRRHETFSGPMHCTH